MQDFEIILVKSSLENGLIFLYQYANDSQIVAGGTTLLPYLQKTGNVKPFLVDFAEIRSLTGIIKKNGFVRIGAMSSLRNIMNSELLNRECPLLIQGIRSIQNRQIINRATLGGAVASSSPFSDVITSLVAYDAKVAVISKTSKRKIELKEMIVAHNRNILQPFEMVGYVEIEIEDKPQKNYYLKRGTYHSAGREQLQIAVNLVMESDGETVEYARIAPGNIFPRPKRYVPMEEVFRGKKFSEDLLLEAAELSKKAVIQTFDPLDSIEKRQKILSGGIYQAMYEAYRQELDNVN